MGITPPSSRGLIAGLSTVFSTGAAHRLENGAVVQDIAALHVQIGHSSTGPSVSTQIATLRNLLLGDKSVNMFAEVAKVQTCYLLLNCVLMYAIQGLIPLVVEAQNADIIASLIQLKNEVKAWTGVDIQLTVTGAAEAHLLAKELGEASIGVILTPSRPFPDTWESRRMSVFTARLNKQTYSIPQIAWSAIDPGERLYYPVGTWCHRWDWYFRTVECS